MVRNALALFLTKEGHIPEENVAQEVGLSVTQLRRILKDTENFKRSWNRYQAHAKKKKIWEDKKISKLIMEQVKVSDRIVTST